MWYNNSVIDLTWPSQNQITTPPIAIVRSFDYDYNSNWPNNQYAGSVYKKTTA